MEQKEKRKKVLKGKVVSDRMTGTVVVAVRRYFKHPKYGKYLNRVKRYKVHDPENTAAVGDEVSIEACRPISKEKHFKLVHK